MKKIFIWTHFDLDGVCSALVAKWAYPSYKVEYKAVAVLNFREELTKWLLNDSFDNYDKVFILDLDVIAHKDLIDKKNVMIVDHHCTLANTSCFENAIPIIKEAPSACLLLYKVFKKLYNVEFTEAQKKLIIYANDYDSYKLELPESRVLNAVFWGSNKSFDTFFNTFKNGFEGFTQQHLNIFKVHISEIKSIIKRATFFKYNNYKIEDKKYSVVSVTADKHMNDIADYVFKKYSPDIVMVVNIKSNRVSIRRKEGVDVDVSVIAEELCEGGGHPCSSGGIITPQFLEFTKKLKPI